MALVNKLGRYIKLDAGNSFEIYLNQEAREKFKNSTPVDVIINKYTEIIQDLMSSKYDEFKYYNGKEYGELLGGWTNELQRYIHNQMNFIYTEEYPLMAQYYPDIADTIPQIVGRGVSSGVLGKHAASAEEAYLQAKQTEVWGETTDA